jgi:hypothetical protein
MPRRNTIGYSRRRTARRPDPESTEVAASFEALARELVRRGLASKVILDKPTNPNDPTERNQQ